MPLIRSCAPVSSGQSIHQPWKATLVECLRRWNGLDPLTREQSYLVIQEQAATRLTLNATKIAALAERMTTAGASNGAATD